MIKMTNKQLEELIDKHTEAQSEANSLFAQIVDELDRVGMLNEHFVVDNCIHNTEPALWGEEMLKLHKLK